MTGASEVTRHLTPLRRELPWQLDNSLSWTRGGHIMLVLTCSCIRYSVVRQVAAPQNLVCPRGVDRFAQAWHGKVRSVGEGQVVAFCLAELYRNHSRGASHSCWGYMHSGTCRRNAFEEFLGRAKLR